MYITLLNKYYNGSFLKEVPVIKAGWFTPVKKATDIMVQFCAPHNA